MAEKRFRALRTLATVVKLTAVLVLLAGIVAGSLLIGMGAVWAEPMRATFPGIGDTAAGPIAVAGGVGLILLGALHFVLLFGAGEGVLLLIAIEQSSRETAELAGRMWSTFGPPRPSGIQPIPRAPGDL